MKKLSIISPVYEEEEVIEKFYSSLKNVLKELDNNYQSSIFIYCNPLKRQLFANIKKIIY